MIASLLPIVLDSNRAPHVTFFVNFLNEAATGTTRITLDQWDSFLLFNTNVKLDLTNYNDNDACKYFMSF